MTTKFHRFVIETRVWTAIVSVLGLSAIVLFCHVAQGAPPGADVRVLIVTGGHDFNEAGFFGMFREMKGVAFAHIAYGQGAEEKLNPKGAKDYDAIVFYDMHQKRDPQWKGIEQLLGEGKGMVFLHHSLWSYDGTWREYRRILGGRASSKEKVVPGPAATSTYKDNQHTHVHVADPSSPVTRGLRDFDIVDEAYNHYWVDPKVHVLLTTDNPASEKVIAWSHRYKKSRIVYVELGHGPSAYENSNYSTFVRQAIFWVARKAF
ncbi:MAG TPA: ThuA domain-containing protein [Terriglobia bacterium]|nr:ThuA domain-containing protein [Terriglobia bacterium]